MKYKNKKITAGLFAYGETGFAALRGLMSDFEVKWIILSLAQGSQDTISVESLALKQKIPVYKINSANDLFKIINKNIPEIVIISSYDKVLPEKILSLTKFINIHHGDLPRWRGRANINWAIINGRKDIGLTFHEAIPNLDEGNIYKQISVPITNMDTVKSVYDKFNYLIEKNIAEVAKKVVGGFPGKPQIGRGTYCCTRLPEDGYIDWSKKSSQIYNLIRGLTKPYPGAFTYFEGKKMIIWDAQIPANPKKFEGRIPGRIVQIQKGYGVEVLTGDSTIIVKNVQYEGKDIDVGNIIKSVKKTLGINFHEFYEKLNRYFKENE
ncbi:methionyl-tRNA formyltransferase [Candidatus Microgenomates bacterium]|nr:MAG: methionyl-tRNA formyltransferase [Candidatus Microgenomates bacterium]